MPRGLPIAAEHFRRFHDSAIRRQRRAGEIRLARLPHHAVIANFHFDGADVMAAGSGKISSSFALSSPWSPRPSVIDCIFDATPLSLTATLSLPKNAAVSEHATLILNSGLRARSASTVKPCDCVSPPAAASARFPIKMVVVADAAAARL